MAFSSPNFGCLPDIHLYDAFIDLSTSDLLPTDLNEYIEATKGDTGLSHTAGFITFLLPSQCALRYTSDLRFQYADDHSPLPLYLAIERAARTDRHLVTILGPLLPRNEALRSLIEDFALDPMFGTVQPRFAESATDHIWPLPSEDRNQSSAHLTRSGLSMLFSHITTPELLAGCIVIR